jgi:hypothetical protein
MLHRHHFIKDYTSGKEVHHRLNWICLLEKTGELGLVIQYQRPKHASKNQKLFGKEGALILKWRCQNSLGARRIQTELRLHHEIDLSITANDKVLQQRA